MRRQAAASMQVITLAAVSGYCLVIGLLSACDALSAEKRLIKDLLDRYKQAGVVGRPVHNIAETINVSMGLSLVQILGLDEKKEVLTINTWNRYSWRDYLLSWNESEYDGIKEVRVPPEDVWKPDIVLYNYADDRLEEKQRVMTVVSSDGTILWMPPAIYKSSCTIDITNFPFDSQICHLKFGSWTYDGSKVDLDFYQNLTEVSLKDYVPSNEWDIIGHPARKNVEYYNCCPEPYLDLTFFIVLRRKAAFYNYILILPCILLSMLTMVLFWLPPESAAKMQLGMNIFVAYFLGLRLLSDSIPASSSIPLIGAYYCMNMVMITMSTFLAVFVIHLSIRGPRKERVPEWLKKFVLVGLAPIVFMTNYVPEGSVKTDRKTSKSGGQSNHVQSKRLCIQELRNSKILTDSDGTVVTQCQLHNGGINLQQDESLAPEVSPDSSPVHLRHTIDSDVKEIRRVMKAMVLKKKSADDMEKIRGEWRAVALILDRLFFIIYILSIMVSLVTMFPRPGA